MPKTKQIIAVTAVVLLMGFLLAQPIKGLVNEDKSSAEATATDASGSVNFQSVSQQAKRGLNAAIIQEISDIESKLKDVSGAEKLDLLQQLAQKWDDVNESAPLGFIYEEMAKIDPQFAYWLNAGDAYRSAYTNLRDTVTAKALNSYAINAYEKALEID